MAHDSRPRPGDHSAVELEVAVDDDTMGEFPIDSLARGRAQPVGFVRAFEQLEQALSTTPRPSAP